MTELVTFFTCSCKQLTPPRGGSIQPSSSIIAVVCSITCSCEQLTPPRGGEHPAEQFDHSSGVYVGEELGIRVICSSIPMAESSSLPPGGGEHPTERYWPE
jgi:hypothetical protein